MENNDKDGLSKFEKKAVNKEIDDAIAKSVMSDNSEEFVDDFSPDFNWDDINDLKTSLGASVVEFATEVAGIVSSPEIMNNLGDRAPYFNKLVSVFFSDIDSMSKKVGKLRVIHENKSGKTKGASEQNEYNRVAIEYQSLYDELNTVITPTLTDIVLTISECVKPDNAVTDVVAKEATDAPPVEEVVPETPEPKTEAKEETNGQ